MNLLKIAVGTTSEQKIGYLKELLSEIGIKAKVFPVDVKSGVSDQPITETETQTGSVNRARAAFKENPNVDFALGIEVGYHKNNNNNFEMFCCTSIIDKADFVTSCFSSKFLLPAFHQNILKENKPLGEFVRAYHKNIDNPTVNYIRELVRGRKPLIIESARNALLSYLEVHITVKHLLETDSLSYRKKSMGIVVDGDEFLVVQLKDYGPNDWNFPGGGIEEGETAKKAVLRELKEELGTNKFEILGVSKRTYEHEWPEFTIAKKLARVGKTYRGQSITTFLVKFIGKREEIKFDPGEVRKIKWIKYDELKNHLLFPHQWENIELILKELKY